MPLVEVISVPFFLVNRNFYRVDRVSKTSVEPTSGRLDKNGNCGMLPKRQSVFENSFALLILPDIYKISFKLPSSGLFLIQAMLL